MTKRQNLRSRKNALASRRLHHETLEKRELLAADFGLDSGPRLISVAANSGQQFDLDGNNLLTIAPTELTFRFDGAQPLDPATLSAIEFRGSGGDGTFDDGNEITIVPGFLGFENANNSRIVVARFAETLPDDLYSVEVAGFDDTDPNNLIVGLRNTNGDLFSPDAPSDSDRPVQSILMNVEVGPRVVAVVPQPITGTGTSRVQDRNVIQVFFNRDPLANQNLAMVQTTGSATDPSVVQPQFYNLYFTSDTVETGDDGVVRTPTSVKYEPSLNRATLTFDSDLDTYAPNGFGTFRLRVGSSQALPVTLPSDTSDQAADVGDTFVAARDLGITFGTTGDSSVTISGEIEATAGNTVEWPGIDSPGIRQNRRDAQVTGRADTADGINVFYYNFADLYGTDASGFNLENAITPAQQQRTREILDLYSEHLGIRVHRNSRPGASDCHR